jgi:hypothetical protein
MRSQDRNGAATINNIQRARKEKPKILGERKSRMHYMETVQK